MHNGHNERQCMVRSHSHPPDLPGPFDLHPELLLQEITVKHSRSPGIYLERRSYSQHRRGLQSNSDVWIVLPVHAAALA